MTQTLREQHGQVLTSIAEAFLDWLEQEHEGEELGVVALVAEMRTPDGSASVPVFYCSDPRRWVQAGLFSACARAGGELP